MAGIPRPPTIHMGDLRTMRARMALDLHETLAGDMLDQVNLAIVDAVKYLANKQFHFNVGTFTFATVVGQESYSLGGAGLPSDLLYIIGDTLYLDEDQTADQSIGLERVTSVKYDRLEVSWGDSNDTPRFWRFFDSKVWLLPRPEAVHDINGRYVKDLTSPTASFDGSNWTFSADGLTSGWFTNAEAEELVRMRACYLLAGRYLKDPKAEAVFLRHSLEKERDLRSAVHQRRVVPRIEGWIPR